MLRILLVFFLTQVMIACDSDGGDDNNPEASDTTELEGTWDGEERDTNVPTVMVVQGNSLSYQSDPQFVDEWYDGTFSLTQGNPSKMALFVSDAWISQYAGKTGLCIYSLDSMKEAAVLACNEPGNPNYPSAFTPTNGTRVWDFSKRADPTNPAAIDLAGRWETACFNDGTDSYTGMWEFLSNGDVTRMYSVFGNNTCSGAPINITDTGVYSLGASIDAQGYPAYKLDVLFESNNPESSTSVEPPVVTQNNLYTIVYLDDAGRLFLGESIDAPEGSSSAATRPTSINFAAAYVQR